MGCQVVSVYNDEVIGKVGYPQSIINDLIDRDYRQFKKMNNYQQVGKQIGSIYGFTQSHTTSKLFFCVIGQKQYAVFAAGRFLVMEEVKNKTQIVMANPDYISSLTVDKKLCLVGLIGGILLVWDLQFQQIKLEIVMPEQSSTVSTVGLTSKYIFATDSRTPNNYIFCYDLRTAKLLNAKVVPSFEPSLRSLSVQNNLHVTVCADGIWFFRMDKTDNQLQITKGMFGRYPKTSMTCLGHVADFIITGGVDGYIYVWRLKTLKCCRVLKVSDVEIASIGVKDKHIIFGCMNGRVKVYTFEVKKRQKKQYVLEVQEDEADDDEEVAFIVVDSYSKEGETIAIAVSMLDPLLYYCQTRQGLLFQQFLPAPTFQKKKVNIKLNLNQTVQRINSASSLYWHQNQVYSSYRGAKNKILVDSYSIEGRKVKLQEERIAVLTEDCFPQFIEYSSSTNQVAYITNSSKLKVNLTFNKIAEAVGQQNISDMGNHSQTLETVQNQNIVSLNFIEHHRDNSPLLCLTTNQTIWVFQRVTKLTYEEKCRIKYQNTVPAHIKINQENILFDQISQKWKYSESKVQSLTPQSIDKQKTIHNSKVGSLQDDWAKGKVSCGGGLMILWKEFPS